MYTEHQINQHSEIKWQLIYLSLLFFLNIFWYPTSFWELLFPTLIPQWSALTSKYAFFILFKQKTNLRNHLGLQTCLQTLLIQKY